MNSIPYLGTNGFVPSKSSGKSILQLIIFVIGLCFVWYLYDFFFGKKELSKPNKPPYKSETKPTGDTDDLKLPPFLR